MQNINMAVPMKKLLVSRQVKSFDNRISNESCYAKIPFTNCSVTGECLVQDIFVKIVKIVLDTLLLQSAVK